jgi:hypothetical protein
MIRVRYVTLPAGLSAVVRKDSDGGLQIFVSDALSADRQRAAVRLALRSIRRRGWYAGLLPVPAGLPLGAFWRSITRALRTHAIASSAAMFLAVAGAAALIVALPQHHGPTDAGQRPSRGQVHAPAPGRTHVAAKPGRGPSSRPVPGPKRVAGGYAGARPGPMTTPGAPKSAPPVSPPASAKPSKPAAAPPSGTASPTPTAAPSSSPAPPSGGVTCLVILGVWVCL